MTKFAPIVLLATVATLAVVPTTVFAAETNQQVRERRQRPLPQHRSRFRRARRSMAPTASASDQVYNVTAAGDVQVILNSRSVHHTGFEPERGGWQGRHQPDQEGNHSPLIPPFQRRMTEGRREQSRRPF